MSTVIYGKSNFVKVSVVDAYTVELDWTQHATNQGVLGHHSNSYWYNVQINNATNSASLMSSSYIYTYSRITNLVWTSLQPSTSYYAIFLFNGSQVDQISFTTPKANPKAVVPVRDANNYVHVYAITHNSACVSWTYYFSQTGYSQYDDDDCNYCVTLTLKDISTGSSSTPLSNNYSTGNGLSSYKLTGLAKGRSYTLTWECETGDTFNVNFTTASTEIDYDDEDDEKGAGRLEEPSGFQKESFGENKLAELKKCSRATNVLLLGGFGHGKSSFLNNLLRACGSDEEARVGGGDYHTTIKLEKYSIKDTKVHLWDCFGFSKKNFDTVLLDKILDGHFLPGKKMEEGISRDQKAYNMYPTEEDMMHNVIFVVAADEITDNEELIEKMKDFTSLLKDKEYNSVIVLTKIDLVDSKLSKNPEKSFESSKISKLVHKVSKLSGFPPNKIVPVKNYNIEYERKKILENGPLLALHIACSKAQHFDQLFKDSSKPSPDEKKDDVKVVKGTEDKDMKKFLAKNGLEECAALFGELGVTAPSHLKYVEEQDLIDAGCKKVTLRVIMGLKKEMGGK
jgi:putative ribosome biogenesis GTPase RsgA